MELLLRSLWPLFSQNCEELFSMPNANTIDSTEDEVQPPRASNGIGAATNERMRKAKHIFEIIDFPAGFVCMGAIPNEFYRLSVDWARCSGKLKWNMQN